jgi:uncharacterized protein YjbI with pentapeptide repeats
MVSFPGASLVLLFVIAVVNADSPFVVDLSLPPEQRWTEVASTHEAQMKAALALMNEYLTPLEHSLADVIAADLDAFLGDVGAEMKGIATAANMDVGDVVLFNLASEFLPSGCSGMLGADESGMIWHGRNLDWEGTENDTQLLQALSVHVILVNGSRSVRAETWAGYVGILTGMVPYKFSVSSNWRYTNVSVYEEIAEALLRGAKLRGLSIRDALLSATDYDDAAVMLATDRIVGPVYFIVAGASASQGTILSRDAETSFNPRDLNGANGTWHLAQANWDWWVPNSPSEHGVERVGFAEGYWTAYGRAAINNQTMLRLMSTPPVHRPSTVYTAIMCAGSNNFYSVVWGQ